ncbi:M20/M25/M40 family metallo-hydrolase [Sulfidibacter corallicola]|uniref:M20/M25/M40 family metallo-hydrolase n=1 Tax=Sulfidibacter corallicola TaxID=2818388 RepID=A0A8A4TNS6_SULCO|nr:M20/M25/M40 family metallo-hydrolase [Sulfidibacter corallicola]QTD50551.1 M20/M25/M40 family metallo-hydrolase [Sulfidibacter corallicola]
MKFYLPLLLAFLATSASIASEDLVWITLDRSEAHAIQSALKRSYKVDLVIDATKNSPIAAARIARKDLAALTSLMHRDYGRCSGYLVHKTREEALAMRPRLEQIKNTPRKKMNYTIDNGEVARALADTTVEDSITDVIESLSAFPNRLYYHEQGVAAAHWLRDHWTSLLGDREDVTIQLFTHDFEQPSVILSIQGTRFPDEVVVVGGHLDSTSRDTAAPGADDDASGIATLTEVIRTIAETDFRPERSLRFMGYAGEEFGLLGSRDIAESYREANVDVVGVLQLDMTNYHGSDKDIWFLTDYTDDDLTQFLGQLVDTYLTDLTWDTTVCGYGCSDHAAWTGENYPAAMPFEARFGQHNFNLHTENDTLAQSGGRSLHAHKFARVAAVFVAEVAKGGFGAPVVTVNRATVDILTMGRLLSGMGPCPPAQDCSRDMDGDRDVDLDDFRHLLNQWENQGCFGFVEGPVCLD